MPRDSVVRKASSSSSRICDLRAFLVDDLDVEAERLHLLDEHLEALGDARLGDVLALDDGLVDLHPAEHVVGLDGEDLLERVRRAVGLEGPHLHLTEALATELRLPTQRLLGDHRVRARRPGVDLVVDEVAQLQDVDVADRDRAGRTARRCGRRRAWPCPSSADELARPSAPSGCRCRRRSLDRALRARLASVSSQWAPSNTGVVTQTAGSVIGRVLFAGRPARRAGPPSRAGPRSRGALRAPGRRSCGSGHRAG